jgi:hypothetical protein
VRGNCWPVFSIEQCVFTRAIGRGGCGRYLFSLFKETDRKSVV